MDEAFLAVKRALDKSGFLMHFDSSLPVTVACDASPVGLGWRGATNSVCISLVDESRAEVVIQKSTTSEATVNVLRTMFSRGGIPHTLVSDNSPQFKSQEFKDFLDWLGVLHKPTSPYHPSCNGQAERFVQTVKQALKVMASSGESLQVRLDKFLLAYRNAPHAFTGEMPAVRFMGRQLRTRLDSVKPDNRRENKRLEKQSVVLKI